MKPWTKPEPQYEEPRFQEAPENALPVEKILPSLDTSPNEKLMSQLGYQSSFFLSDIVLQGNTILSESMVDEIIRPYRNRHVTMAQLQDIRQRLSVHYFEKGYINSGVIIPHQEVKNGVVLMQAIEGKIATIYLEGNQGLKDRYILSRVNNKADSPLNISLLRTSLAKIQRNPLIEKIDAQLRPGSAAGEALLYLNVAERDKHFISLGINNHQSVNVGAENISLNYGNTNLSGWGDAFSFVGRGSQGAKAISLSYAVPLNANDTTLYASYTLNDSKLVGSTFKNLDIGSRFSGMSGGITHPVFSGEQSLFSITGGVDYKKSESFLEGEPISLSQGDVNGASEITAFGLGVEWSRRTPSQVILNNILFRAGLEEVNTFAHNLLAITAQSQYAQRLSFWRGSQFIVKATTQLTKDNAASIEKFSLGGINTVRGARENQIVRDNGLAASAELRLPMDFWREKNDEVSLFIAPFVDWGRAWDHTMDPDPDNDEELEIEYLSLFSLGLGLIWQPIEEINAELYWAETLVNDNEIPQGDNLQDHGLHASISYRYHF